MDSDDIYNEKYVEDLFDKMSKTYDRMNSIFSFGFNGRWRDRCVSNAHVKKGDVVADLMTGMGECWKPIIKRTGSDGKIIALDFSRGMLALAKRKINRFPDQEIIVLRENVFSNSISDNSVDVIISGFGIKTFSEAQLNHLANESRRILKPGGKISMVEISVPKSMAIRLPYLFYLKLIIPLIGKIFLGNPETYRMLGIYTTKFGSVEKAKHIFERNGFNCQSVQYTFGCATGIVGELNH